MIVLVRVHFRRFVFQNYIACHWIICNQYYHIIIESFYFIILHYSLYITYNIILINSILIGFFKSYHCSINRRLAISISFFLVAVARSTRFRVKATVRNKFLKQYIFSHTFPFSTFLVHTNLSLYSSLGYVHTLLTYVTTI